MVFEYGNIVAVSKDELLPFYKSYDNLKKTLQRYKEKPYGPKRVMVGGNGRQLLIDFDTLPPEIKQALPDPRKCDHILERYYEVDAEAVRFYSLFQFEDGSYLSTEHQEKYIVNASMLRAVIRLREARISERRRKGGKVTGIMHTLVSDAVSFNKTLLAKHRVEHTLPTSVARFKATLKEFETLVDSRLNYSALISNKHKNKNSLKVDDRTLKLLNDLFADAQRKPTARDVSRQYEAFVNGYVEVVDNSTGELYDPTGFKPLSDATIANYLHSWANKIGTFAIRSGNRQRFMGQFKPHHSLDRPKFAGSIISIDDRQPPFKSLDGKRVWFYNGIDLGSEAFTCWVYGESKEGIITEFYRQLVRNYHEWGFNLPHELEAEMSLNSSFVDTFLREGAMFQKVRIEANNARGKRIERYYGSLRYEYEKEREGWLARPHALKESNQQGVDVAKVPAVPYEDIIDGCLADIEKWNNAPHAVHTDKTRWEVFCEMQHPELQPTNYIAILPHIGYKTETSVRAGIIRLQRQEFLIGIDGKVALSDKLISLMARIEGRDIDVYWLDGNNGEVIKALIFYNGQYVCEAVRKPTYNRATLERTPQDETNREIMSSYVASVEAFGRRMRQNIGSVTVIEQPKEERTGSFRIPSRNRVRPVEEREPQELPQIEDVIDTDYTPISKSLKDRF